MKTISGLILALLPISTVLALDIVKDQSAVRFSADGKPVAEYRYADVPFKPYMSQLHTPSGVAILRDSPSDHKHHHSLMFAIGADGVDFWSETPKCGKQSNKQIETGKDSLTQQLEWTTADGKPVLGEKRMVKVNAAKDLPATLVTWRTELEPAVGKDEVKLTGSHYFGLGVRFLVSMDKIGTFLNSSGLTGDVVRGTERLSPAKWCAYSAPADGKMVTVAVFDHPSNIRHPNKFFTMSEPFSYISSTLNLWKEPYVLKAGQPLRLCYGVAAWDGKTGSDEIEKTYQGWLKITE